MYRYSERAMRFKFPFNPADCTAFIVSFKQGDLLLEKDKTALADNISKITEENGEYIMYMSFTQEESGAFVADKKITVQATFVLDGVRDETNKKSFSLSDVLKDGVVDG